MPINNSSDKSIKDNHNAADKSALNSRSPINTSDKICNLHAINLEYQQARPQTQRAIDEFWMQQCLELAKKGFGSISPNPAVGCVIIKNNRCIAFGYHEAYGSAHAEINAVNQSTATRC
jgi:deoxycytidylate deaminase